MDQEKKFTALHRLLHWVMALALTVLFITGFLRMYWMNKNKIVEIISSKTDTLDKEQMTEIAKAIREPMWEWHINFATVMILAIAARLIYMLLKGIRFPSPFNSNNTMKERMQGVAYFYFYLIVVFSAITGICLKYGFFDSFHQEIEAAHKWGIFLYPIFIVIHLIGITIGEHTDSKGIVSKMIGGHKNG